MLEGAKLIGARFGNVFSSLIHSVARNPALAGLLLFFCRFITCVIVSCLFGCIESSGVWCQPPKMEAGFGAALEELQSQANEIIRQCTLAQEQGRLGDALDLQEQAERKLAQMEALTERQQALSSQAERASEKYHLESSRLSEEEERLQQRCAELESQNNELTEKVRSLQGRGRGK